MSVRRSLAWSYGAQGLIFVQSFAISVIVARILGPFEMGVFAVGASIVGAISTLSAFGVSAYLIRHEAPDAAVKATAFTVNGIICISVSLVIYAVVIAGPAVGLDPKVRQVLALLGLTPLIGIFDLLPSAFAQREMNFRLISLVAIAKSVLASTLMLALALNGFGYLSPPVGSIGAALFGVIATSIAVRRHVSIRMSFQGWRQLTAFGLQMMSIGGLASLVQRLSELILTHFLGITALGIYSRASSLSQQVWDNVYGLGTRVIFSRMATEMRETRTVRRTFTQGLRMISATMIPLFAGIAVLSLPLIQTLYGDQWLAAAPPLSILMVTNIIALGFGMNWELCVIRERTGWQARNEGIRAVFGLVAYAVGAFFSIALAAAGRAVEAVCGLFLFGPKMREMAGTEPGEIRAIYQQSAALTLAATLPAFCLMVWCHWSPHVPWSSIAPAVGLGVLLWLGLLKKLRHPLLTELNRARVFFSRRFA